MDDHLKTIGRTFRRFFCCIALMGCYSEDGFEDLRDDAEASVSELAADLEAAKEFARLQLVQVQVNTPSGVKIYSGVAVSPNLILTSTYPEVPTDPRKVTILTSPYFRDKGPWYSPGDMRPYRDRVNIVESWRHETGLLALRTEGTLSRFASSHNWWVSLDSLSTKERAGRGDDIICAADATADIATVWHRMGKYDASYLQVVPVDVSLDPAVQSWPRQVPVGGAEPISQYGALEGAPCFTKDRVLVGVISRGATPAAARPDYLTGLSSPMFALGAAPFRSWLANAGGLTSVAWNRRGYSSRYQLRIRGTFGLAGGCLDVADASTAPGAKINIFACDPAKRNQQFYLYRSHENDDRSAMLRNENSGLCVTVPSGTTSEAYVEQQACSGADGQRWNLDDLPETWGAYYIRRYLTLSPTNPPSSLYLVAKLIFRTPAGAHPVFQDTADPTPSHWELVFSPIQYEHAHDC